MKPIRFLLAALAFAALSGCYTSDKQLVSEDQSVADYARITFQAKEPDNKPATFVRDGRHYVTTGDDGTTVDLRLMKVEGDYYVAEMAGKGSSGEVDRLYGYLHLDVPSKVAEAWRTYGTDADVQPGLRKCKDAICIDDLAVYIAYAKKAVDAKEPPDTVYTVTVEE